MRRLGRGLLTVFFALFYALSFGAGVTLRGVVTAWSWTASAVLLGWHDAWPRPAEPEVLQPGQELMPNPPRHVRTR